MNIYKKKQKPTTNKHSMPLYVGLINVKMSWCLEAILNLISEKEFM